jgi:hypothetical protein
MQVHQRIAVATSANFGSNYAGYLTADRWYSEVPYLFGYGTISQTIENDAPTGSGFRKSLKHAYSSSDGIASGKYFWISQKLEGQDCQAIRKGTASAQSLTLSFWVKSNLTGTYIAELVDVDNTRYVSQSYTINSSGTWEFKTVTFPPDTTGVLDNDNNESLRLNFWLRGGSNFSGGASLQTTWGTTGNTRAVGQVDLAATVGNYWQVTGVKLEVGASATNFDFKSFGQDLAECQRYYFRISPTGNGNVRFGIGDCRSTTQCEAIIHLPVTMRALPNILDTTATASNYGIFSGGGVFACTVLPTIMGESTLTSASILATTTGLTAGRVAQFFSNNNTSAYLGISAEL